MTQDRLHLVQLAEHLRQAWSRPHPAFASGMDTRSSENALLLQLHGNLVKASGLGWQNAGRTLIDKTYLRILKVCFGLDFHGFGEDELAARLDGFIRQALAPRWGQVIASVGSEGLSLASELLEACNGALFASERLQAATQQVLFYLCPHLPFLPCPGDPAQSAEHYQALFRTLPPLPRPQQFAGNAQQQALIRQLVEGSDWWGRRVLSARQAEMAHACCAP